MERDRTKLASCVDLCLMSANDNAFDAFFCSFYAVFSPGMHWWVLAIWRPLWEPCTNTANHWDAKHHRASFPCNKGIKTWGRVTLIAFFTVCRDNKEISFVFCLFISPDFFVTIIVFFLWHDRGHNSGSLAMSVRQSTCLAAPHEGTLVKPNLNFLLLLKKNVCKNKGTGEAHTPSGCQQRWPSPFTRQCTTTWKVTPHQPTGQNARLLAQAFQPQSDIMPFVSVSRQVSPEPQGPTHTASHFFSPTILSILSLCQNIFCRVLW